MYLKAEINMWLLFDIAVILHVKIQSFCAIHSMIQIYTDKDIDLKFQ